MPNGIEEILESFAREPETPKTPKSAQPTSAFDILEGFAQEKAPEVTPKTKEPDFFESVKRNIRETPGELFEGLKRLPSEIGRTAAGLIQSAPGQIAGGFASLLRELPLSEQEILQINQPLVRADLEDEKKEALKKVKQAKTKGQRIRESVVPELIDFGIKQQEKGAKITKGTIQSIRDIKDEKGDVDVGKAINFVGNAFLQTLGQAGIALLTRGQSTIFQESGDTYLSTVRALAEEKKITPQQVIDRGLDSPALALASGIISKQMELIGADKIFKNFGIDNVEKSLKDYAKEILASGVTEAGTELGQELNSIVFEELGKGRSAKEIIEEIKQSGDRLIDATIGGGVGGSGIRSLGSFVSRRNRLRDGTATLEDQAIGDSPESDVQEQIAQAQRDLETERVRQEAQLEQPIIDPQVAEALGIPEGVARRPEGELLPEQVEGVGPTLTPEQLEAELAITDPERELSDVISDARKSDQQIRISELEEQGALDPRGEELPLIRKLNEEIDATRDDITGLERDIDVINTDIEGLNNRLEAFDDPERKLGRNMSEQAKDIEKRKIRARIAQKESNVASKQNKIRSKETERFQKEARIDKIISDKEKEVQEEIAQVREEIPTVPERPEVTPREVDILTLIEQDTARREDAERVVGPREIPEVTPEPTPDPAVEPEIIPEPERTFTIPEGIKGPEKLQLRTFDDQNKKDLSRIERIREGDESAQTKANQIEQIQLRIDKRTDKAQKLITQSLEKQELEKPKPVKRPEITKAPKRPVTPKRVEPDLSKPTAKNLNKAFEIVKDMATKGKTREQIQARLEKEKLSPKLLKPVVEPFRITKPFELGRKALLSRAKRAPKAKTNLAADQLIRVANIRAKAKADFDRVKEILLKNTNFKETITKDPNLSFISLRKTQAELTEESQKKLDAFKKKVREQAEISFKDVGVGLEIFATPSREFVGKGFPIKNINRQVTELVKRKEIFDNADKSFKDLKKRLNDTFTQYYLDGILQGRKPGPIEAKSPEGKGAVEVRFQRSRDKTTEQKIKEFKKELPVKTKREKILTVRKPKPDILERVISALSEKDQESFRNALSESDKILKDIRKEVENEFALGSFIGGIPKVRMTEQMLTNKKFVQSVGKIGYLIFKSGVKSFNSWSNRMVQSIGESIKPYLKTIYDAIVKGWKPGQPLDLVPTSEPTKQEQTQADTQNNDSRVNVPDAKDSNKKDWFGYPYKILDKNEFLTTPLNKRIEGTEAGNELSSKIISTVDVSSEINGKFNTFTVPFIKKYRNDKEFKALNQHIEIQGLEGIQTTRGIQLENGSKPQNETEQRYVDELKKFWQIVRKESNAVGITKVQQRHVPVYTQRMQRAFKSSNEFDQKIKFQLRKKTIQYNEEIDPRFKKLSDESKERKVRDFLETSVDFESKLAGTTLQVPPIIIVDGKTIPVVETNSLITLRATARSLSQQFAFRRVFKTNKVNSVVEDFSKQISEESGLDQKRDIERVFDAYFGRVQQDVSDNVVTRFVNNIFIPVASALQLSTMAIVNLPQPLVLVPSLVGKGSYSGYGRVLNQYAKLIKDVAKRRGTPEALDYMRSIGAIGNDIYVGNFEKGRRSEQIGNLIGDRTRELTAANFVVKMNDLVTGMSFKAFADNIVKKVEKKDNLSFQETETLKRLGFNQKQVDFIQKNMAEGDLFYNRIIRQGIKKTQFTRLSNVERSLFQNNPALSALFAYQSYAIGTVQAIKDPLKRVLDTKTSWNVKVNNVNKLLSFSLGAVAAGNIALFLKALAFDRPFDRDDEDTEEKIVSWIWVPFMETTFIAPFARVADSWNVAKDPAKVVTTFTPYLNFGFEIGAFSFGLDAYQHRSWTERMALFLRKNASITRVAAAQFNSFANTFFGDDQVAALSAVGLAGEDPYLNEAVRRYYKFKRETLKESFIPKNEDYNEFKRQMRLAVENAKRDGDFRKHLKAAFKLKREELRNPERARKAVFASLNARRLLTKRALKAKNLRERKERIKQLQKEIGDQRFYNLLVEYDRLIIKMSGMFR